MEWERRERRLKAKRQEVTVLIQFTSDEGLNLSSGSGNGRRETDFKRFNKWNQKVLMIK